MLVAENGMLSIGVVSAQISGFTERCVKYIANSAAKNINSLESQTIVPTDARLGLSTECWAGVAVAVVTRRILAKEAGLCVRGGPFCRGFRAWLESQYGFAACRE